MAPGPSRTTTWRKQAEHRGKPASPTSFARALSSAAGAPSGGAAGCAVAARCGAEAIPSGSAGTNARFVTLCRLVAEVPSDCRADIVGKPDAARRPGGCDRASCRSPEDRMVARQAAFDADEARSRASQAVRSDLAQSHRRPRPGRHQVGAMASRLPTEAARRPRTAKTKAAMTAAPSRRVVTGADGLMKAGGRARSDPRHLLARRQDSRRATRSGYGVGQGEVLRAAVATVDPCRGMIRSSRAAPRRRSGRARPATGDTAFVTTDRDGHGFGHYCPVSLVAPESRARAVRQGRS